MSKPEIPRLSRKSFLRKMIRAAGQLVGLGVVAGAYSYFWEREWIQVVRLPIEIAGLGEHFKGTKLVHFSDLHLGHYFETEDL